MSWELTRLSMENQEPDEPRDQPVQVRDARGYFCDLWCVFDGDSFDLCDHHLVPDWLEYELDCIDLAEAFSGRFDAACAALALGVAPWQPFLARFRQPKYRKDYWGEWDSDGLVGEMIGASPMSVENVAKAWEEWIALGYADAEKCE